jgi:hypothetical protein
VFIPQIAVGVDKIYIFPRSNRQQSADVSTYLNDDGHQAPLMSSQR